MTTDDPLQLPLWVAEDHVLPLSADEAVMRACEDQGWVVRAEDAWVILDGHRRAVTDAIYDQLEEALKVIWGDGYEEDELTLIRRRAAEQEQARLAASAEPTTQIDGGGGGW